MATASTSSLRSSIPGRADVTQVCYDIEFELMQMEMMRRESEDPGPHLARPGIGSGDAECFLSACRRRLGSPEFSVRPKYRKKVFDTKLANDLRGKTSHPRGLERLGNPLRPRAIGDRSHLAAPVRELGIPRVRSRLQLVRFFVEKVFNGRLWAKE